MILFEVKIALKKRLEQYLLKTRSLLRGRSFVEVITEIADAHYFNFIDDVLGE